MSMFHVFKPAPRQGANLFEAIKIAAKESHFPHPLERDIITQVVKAVCALAPDENNPEFDINNLLDALAPTVPPVVVLAYCYLLREIGLLNFDVFPFRLDAHWTAVMEKMRRAAQCNHEIPPEEYIRTRN